MEKIKKPKRHYVTQRNQNRSPAPHPPAAPPQPNPFQPSRADLSRFHSAELVTPNSPRKPPIFVVKIHPWNYSFLPKRFSLKIYLVYQVFLGFNLIYGHWNWLKSSRSNPSAAASVIISFQIQARWLA